jgi:hypothetical protein
MSPQEVQDAILPRYFQYNSWKSCPNHSFATLGPNRSAVDWLIGFWHPPAVYVGSIHIHGCHPKGDDIRL